MARPQRTPEIPHQIDVTHRAKHSSLELAMRIHDDKLDRLVTELIRTTVLKDDEQDAIASRSDMFSAVRARIIADDVTRIERTSTITFFQRSAILTTAAAVIVMAVFGTMMIAKRPAAKVVVDSVPPVQHSDNFVPKYVVDPGMPPTNVEAPEIKSPPVRVIKAMDYHPIVSERRVPVQREPQLEEQPPRFFALAGLRPSEVADDGSRIIRVELPRASLVSLGVNIPLDSDKQLIKTDLLVGPDGVPRAIRLVD